MVWLRRRLSLAREGMMKRSTERILTDPYRQPAASARPAGDDPGRGVARSTRRRSRGGSARRWRRSCGGRPAGIDVNDGEQGKRFRDDVTQRVAGFGGDNTETRVFADHPEFPDCPGAGGAEHSPTDVRRGTGLAGDAGVQTDIENVKEAVAAKGHVEAFLPAPSPGIVADSMVEPDYPSDEAYLYALADEFKREYRGDCRAGLVFQIDAPDAAMGRHVDFRGSRWKGSDPPSPSASKR